MLNKFFFLAIFLLNIFYSSSYNCGRFCRPKNGEHTKQISGISPIESADNDDMNNLSEDELSFVLSNLSLDDLHKLTKLISESENPGGAVYDGFRGHFRNIRDTNLKTVEEENEIPAYRNPEQKIHEEIQSIRNMAERRYHTNSLRGKREVSNNNAESNRNNDEPLNSEYIKLLENSFPNNEFNSFDMNKSLKRVKRSLDNTK